MSLSRGLTLTGALSPGMDLGGSQCLLLRHVQGQGEGSPGAHKGYLGPVSLFIPQDLPTVPNATSGASRASPAKANLISREPQTKSSDTLALSEPSVQGSGGYYL